LALNSTFKTKTYYLDPSHNRSAIQTIVNYYSNFPTFIENKVNLNGKIYIWINGMNISPPPCLYQMASSSGTSLWNTPTLTPLGSIMGESGNLNLYTSGTDLNEIWFYNDQSQPMGLLDLNERDPAGPASVTGYQTTTPDPSNFVVPSLCFPQANGTFFRFDKREVSAISFPNAFSMEYSGIMNNYQFTSRTLYYDATTSMTKIRIDIEGYTILQIGTALYYYVMYDDVQIDPLPCAYFNNEPSIWVVPNFSRLLANVTINGQTSGVYSALNYPFTSLLQYWYFSSNGMPQYFMNFEFIIAQITSFQASPPAPIVFDIPSQCNSVPINN